jgi:hypothetical protein
MPIYDFNDDLLVEIIPTSLFNPGMSYQDYVRGLVRENVEVFLPRSLILAENLDGLGDLKSHIDFLGVDKDRNLIIVELLEPGIHGGLKIDSIRAASIVSTFNYDHVLHAYQQYVVGPEVTTEFATRKFFDFLEVDEGPISFTDHIRIVLIATHFSELVTSTVSWLNVQGLNITCIRLKSYCFRERFLVDVNQILPLREGLEYQRAVLNRLTAHSMNRLAVSDNTRYNLLTPHGEVYMNLSKDRLVYEVVKLAISFGVKPVKIIEVLSWRGLDLFVASPGILSSSELMKNVNRDITYSYFCRDSDLFYVDDFTYALTSQWSYRCEDAVRNVIGLMPESSGLNYESVR